VQQRVPGLAVDAAGRRAFVVAPGVVGEVRLDDLAVSYHRLERQTSLLDRVRDWLEPAAEAKDATGPVRTALRLPGGKLAVAGQGVRIVDTRSWRVREIDARADALRMADGLLLASGPDGVAAYDTRGRERFRVLAGKAAWVDQAYGGRAYVTEAGVDGDLVVELATGRVFARRPSVPWLLAAPAGSWWED
jgi:hypothetical protein